MAEKEKSRTIPFSCTYTRKDGGFGIVTFYIDGKYHGADLKEIEGRVRRQIGGMGTGSVTDTEVASIAAKVLTFAQNHRE